MRNPNTVFSLLFFMVLFSLAFQADAYVFTPESQNPGSDSIYLSYNETQSQGTTLAMDVMVNTLSDTTPAFGAAFDLDFDPLILSYDGLIPGNFFEGTNNADNSTVVGLISRQEGTTNKLVVGISQTSGDTAVSGSGVLLTLKFTVAPGIQTLQGDIAFSNMNLMSSEGLVIDNLNWYGGRLIQSPLAITTSSIPEATQGSNFITSISISGGFSPYTWSATGNIPAGLSMNSDNGYISGVPTIAGVYLMTIRVIDAGLQEVTQDLTMTINPPPNISTTSLAMATTNQAYSDSLSGTGGTTPLTWGISSGNLPTGILLDGSTGVLSGAPTSSGTFAFTIQLVDANGAVGTVDFAMTVNTGPAITTSTLPETTVGSAYNSILQVTGGTGPYTWDIPAGLPSGLSLTADTGEILGIPSTTGNWQFTVSVRDSYGASTTESLEILVNPAPDIITSSVSNIYQGTSASDVAFTATGGVAPYTWNVSSGSLPPGLVLDEQTGTVSGSPTTPGIYSFALLVTDSSGITSSSEYTLAILANPPGNVEFAAQGSEYRVDGYDLIALMMAFDTTAESTLWNPLADLDGSGMIDNADLTILQENFGQSITP